MNTRNVYTINASKSKSTNINASNTNTDATETINVSITKHRWKFSGNNATERKPHQWEIPHKVSTEDEGVELWDYAHQTTKDVRNDKEYIKIKLAIDPDFKRPMVIRYITKHVNDKNMLS